MAIDCGKLLHISVLCFPFASEANDGPSRRLVVRSEAKLKAPLSGAGTACVTDIVSSCHSPLKSPGTFAHSLNVLRILVPPWETPGRAAVTVKGQHTGRKTQAWPLPTASVNNMFPILTTILLNRLGEIVLFLGNSGE